MNKENEEVEGQPNEEPHDEEPTLPSAVEIDGEQVSLDDLKAGYMRHSDYTRKTQALAAERKAVQEKLKSTPAADPKATANAKEIVEALDADIEFYNTHPQAEWKDYTPKVNRFRNGQTPSTPSVDPAVKDDLSEIKDKLNAQERREQEKAQAAAVDAVLNTVDEGVEKYPLADQDLVIAKIEAYQAVNEGKLPSRKDVLEFAQSIHNRIKAKGAPVPTGKEVTKSTKPDISTTPAANKPRHAELDLNADPDKVEDALNEFIASGQASKG